MKIAIVGAGIAGLSVGNVTVIILKVAWIS